MAKNANRNVVYGKLKALRKSMDMSQQEFAEWLSDKRDYARVTQSMISAFENKNKRLSQANDRWLRGVVGMLPEGGAGE